MLTERGCVAGVGFSSAGGLAVTRSSSSYGYEVLGSLASSVVVLSKRRYPEAIPVAEAMPAEVLDIPVTDNGYVRFMADGASIRIVGLIVYRPVRLRGIRGVGLLAAYGEDLPTLLGRWASALRQRGIRIVHMVTTPSSPLRRAAASIGPRFTAPFSREPYYLIARALGDDTPRVLFDLDRWDCVGGDIL